jgi:SAM-dependent methyltransferase
VDRLGVYLSEKMVLKYFNPAKDNAGALLDLGCGYEARLLRKLAPRVSGAFGVDIAVSGEVKSLEGISIYEDHIESAVKKLQAGTFDIITIINVLEHLDDPLSVLKESRRLLKKEGFLLVNVPTWRGKFFLEISAYVKLSPRLEIEDHKTYFNRDQLWPLLVRAGFKPSGIEMRYHKFGLNLFAACRKKEA